LLALAGSASAADYRIGAGDKLSVVVYGESELTRELVVDDTCAVTVGLVGRVESCGKTTSELEAVLTEKWSKGFLVNPQVVVQVVSYRSQFVEVDGEVQRRGRQWLEGTTTLAEAITAAGGPRAENVVDVTLYSVDGTIRRFDLASLATAEPVYLRSGDRVSLNPGRLVYVQGEVQKEGPVVFRDGLTVSQALGMAGGPGDYANVRRVSVIRADGSQTHVNLSQINLGRAEDVVLGPEDRVIVSRSWF
jgi:protein involved in polysaccharide export with SLBB domain